MAEDNRTEQATPRKREKAREEGRVAISRDLTAGLAFGAAALVAQALWPRAGKEFARLSQWTFTLAGAQDLDAHCLSQMAQAWGARMVDCGECGHINAESGLGEWPEGQALLHTLMKD